MKLISVAFFLGFGILSNFICSPGKGGAAHQIAYQPGEQVIKNAAVTGDDKLNIASFNIQNFGKTKMRQLKVVDTLVTIFLKYDIVAVQEISHKKGDTPKRFLDHLNKQYKGSFDMLISEMSGIQKNDIPSQEQYGFYFKKDKIEKLDQGILYPDEQNDFFQREPYMAHFKSKNGSFDFVLITIHTAPATGKNPLITMNEVSAIAEVIKWAKKHYPTEKDFIVVGDFNADCDYLDEADLEKLEIKKNCKWLIPNSEKTNLAKGAQCTYDRILITNACNENFSGKWGVDRCFTSRKVSDHWPVWAEFNILVDTD